MIEQETFYGFSAECFIRQHFLYSYLHFSAKDIPPVLNL